LLDVELDEASRRWLVGPRGLLAACHDAVALEDRSFLDEVAGSELLDQLDEFSPGLPPPRPSARGAALLDLTRAVLDGAPPSALERAIADLVSGTAPEPAAFELVGTG